MLEFLLIELTQVFQHDVDYRNASHENSQSFVFLKNKFHTKKPRPIKVFGLFCLYVYKFIHKVVPSMTLFYVAHVIIST